MPFLPLESPTLVDVMQRLDHTLDTTAVKKFTSKKRSVIKFDQLQSKVFQKPLRTHAELQLILSHHDDCVR